MAAVNLNFGTINITGGHWTFIAFFSALQFRLLYPAVKINVTVTLVVMFTLDL